MKELGSIAKLFQWLGITFLGWKIATDRQTIKNLKDKVDANAIKDELASNSADDDIAAVARLRDK